MKKIFILFAATCIASAAWADAVYEPLIVSSGFNRDIVAEVWDTTRTKDIKSKDGLRDSIVEYRSRTYAESYYVTNYFSIQYTLPTLSALRQKYPKADETTIVKDVNNRDQNLFSSALPDDTGGPEARRVNCYTSKYPGLYWILGDYEHENALCIRRNDDTRNPLPDHGKFEFKNIGCYQKLYFAVIAGGFGGDAEAKTMHTKVYYSNGEPIDTTFNLYDHGNLADTVKAFHDNIFKGEDWVQGNWTEKTHCFAAVCEMGIDQHRLIDSIVFTYQSTSKNAGIAILAVTGKVADIAAPDAENAKVSEITSTSFEACWDAITEAASYRLDVATDIDFHHILAAYNNKEITGTTCQEVADLVANHEYYWRVRAVDSEGGQSASSAPRRVRTESVDGPKATNDDDHHLKTNDITPLLNTTTNLTINRKLYKDGYYNTLCLPFDQSAADLAETTNPLFGFTIYEFEEATKIGDAQLDIHVKVTDHIEAGVPYLLAWSTQTDEVLTSLEFKGVTITTDEGRTIGGPDKVQFVGNISTTGENGMENGNRNHLFIGANNELFWPNTSNGLKGFRAHFEVPASGPAYVPRNSPARIVVQTNVATGVENTSANSAGAKKQLENGQLVIIRDNIRYNVMGLKLR